MLALRLEAELERQIAAFFAERRIVSQLRPKFFFRHFQLIIRINVFTLYLCMIKYIRVSKR